jgi:predicted Zn-dependent protease
MLKYLLQRWLLGAVVRIVPGAEWAQFHLGNAHAEHGHLKEALGPWARACAHVPPRPAAALNLAAALLEQGDPAGATTPLEALVAHAHQNAQAWALLGKARQKSGALPSAILAYEQVIVLEPANDLARLTAAVLLEKTQRRDEAAAHYRAITDPTLLPKATQRLSALEGPRRAGG